MVDVQVWLPMSIEPASAASALRSSERATRLVRSGLQPVLQVALTLLIVPIVRLVLLKEPPELR